MSDGGKGDTPRPLSVPMEQFDKNFDAIFKKKLVKTYTGGIPNYVTEINDDKQYDPVDNIELRSNNTCGK
jgi:hypothetical protein